MGGKKLTVTLTWQMACHALTNWATESIGNSVAKFEYLRLSCQRSSQSGYQAGMFDGEGAAKVWLSGLEHVNILVSCASRLALAAPLPPHPPASTLHWQYMYTCQITLKSKLTSQKMQIFTAKATFMNTLWVWNLHKYLYQFTVKFKGYMVN